MAASDRKRERKKKELPKPRIPVPPPGYGHPSKKDYKREKKVEIPEDDSFHYDHYRECGCRDCLDENTPLEDLKFLLSRLGLSSVTSYRVTSYG